MNNDKLLFCDLGKVTVTCNTDDENPNIVFIISNSDKDIDYDVLNTYLNYINDCIGYKPLVHFIQYNCSDDYYKEISDDIKDFIWG